MDSVWWDRVVTLIPTPCPSLQFYINAGSTLSTPRADLRSAHLTAPSNARKCRGSSCWGTDTDTAMQKIIDGMLTTGCEATVASFLAVTEKVRAWNTLFG